MIVAWWEGELDRDKLNANLAKEIDPTDMKTAKQGWSRSDQPFFLGAC